jgi:hypothetical protein
MKKMISRKITSIIGVRSKDASAESSGPTTP